ncbi:outer membrane autotransporter protein [Bartonella fuyuanensis]|uniref:Outer membrane autotransporter protein n=1 Tax=Bartonella fuyuanensis TaxID=1460968 RepID=A0A840DV15_9HYPH|nr:autotransporter outer membrane beta-barrel domain-containing protein [Bartonella fuyuanensis]MBB4076800.1 outer membrane autotransporter protein [Bartonella fuyuanensis]
MVYVFREYIFLCNFTIAILYFLQVIYVSAAGSSNDPKGAFYKYDDGKTHLLADKIFYLRSSQESSAHMAPIAAIYVEEAGTIVNASQITVYGDDPSKIFAYGAYVRNGGKLNLIASDFKDVPALRAQNAVISMTVGEIKGTSHAIYAWGRETDIALVSVNIDIEPDNLNVKGMGIISGFEAMVRMSDGTVNFNQIGSFSTLFGGHYLLDTMGITGQGRREETITDGSGDMGELPEVFEVFQGGDVHLKNNFIQLNHMHAFLIKNFSGYVDDNGKLIQKYISPGGFKNTSIKIENNNISVKGEGAYGLYFNVLAPEEVAKMLKQRDGEKKLETETILTGKAFVYLSQTNMTVPDGIAIYAKGNKDYEVKGILELSDATKISGDLLLKAENNSSLLVKANTSSLIGGTRLGDRSVIDLELIRDSTWYLTKSKYNGLRESVSSLSSLSLSNSTLIFDDEDISNGYQTLYIGEKIDANATGKILASTYKKVYRAEGNSQIKLSTFLNDDGSFDPKKTDRILIYGDVAGTTLIYVQNFLKASSKEVYGGKDQTISLIQVSGTAQEDSFKLAADYTTVNGFPYRYHLRAYGPASSFGKADPKNRLVAGEGNFWDFRLESVYIDPEIGGSSQSVSVLSIKPTSTILPPKPEAETMPSEQLSETISPEQPPSVEPSLIPSISSVSEVSEPSETFIPTDSSFTPSTSVPLVPTSVPTAAENSSAVKPMPASFVSIETSTDEVLPSDPSASSSADSVSVPSTVVELQPSTSSGSLDTSANFLVSLDVQPEQKIRAVVPQVPTYLLLTNTLFHAGLMDMTAQNKTLMTMRNAFHSSWKDNEQTAFFLHAYGGSHHYTSNLSSFEYGYGAELDYTAFEVGILLNEIENSQNRTFFGVLGNYGNLSLYPQNVEQSKESAFDKWSVAAYGSLQHDAGFYIDGVLSYSLLKGDVLTLARGKVVALKGKQFSGSLTSGRTFAIGYKDIVFDPQVQVVYQHLQFNPARDIDDLEVNLGKFHQWVGRVGGRLSKMLNVSEGGRVVSFYSKLSYLHSFEDKQFVSFKKDFQLGAFGSSLEAGLGFNARLSSKLSLYGDMTYQHKLKKVGFSGTSFSIRLHHFF